MPSTGPMRTPAASTVGDTDRPRLAPFVRLTYDSARERHVLLSPEAVSVLNGTGATILRMCDGRRTVAEIVATLRGRYDRVDGAEVRDFLARLVAKRCLDPGHAAADPRAAAPDDPTRADDPARADDAALADAAPRPGEAPGAGRGSGSGAGRGTEAAGRDTEAAGRGGEAGDG